ncbi:hypothetical protein GCM10007423_60770 [Dyadobacter endophyticus]|uniref:Transposase DDE domain-containing protein n=1 Tax=Dyadobacter endophyticus TaxID=1749036 RepID=A0ABQ1ZBZ9_9BACT|nr:hypothetical protein GCM10007423_60770 [Dyadobacter endophyticus]
MAWNPLQSKARKKKYSGIRKAERINLCRANNDREVTAGTISPVRYVKSTKIQVKMCALGMNIICRFVNLQNNFINHI